MKNKNEPLLFIETVQTEIKPPEQQLVFDSRIQKTKKDDFQIKETLSQIINNNPKTEKHFKRINKT
ncbi:MAG TPA: hypothetical protein PLA20_07430 [Bacilli bacterium]|jgi:hypothetical protein|nr:hypothetical protein [Acholeplasmataceae bacterium]HOE78309.1 hypothetical protein [Bacilli bacterium]HOR96677.1 hypothetical protein [Bacilli bacterium]HPD12722.1 hypothetical protein [Bacilli bacterium]HPN90978.1 hypothetical protein [Bacilli bacterium]